MRALPILRCTAALCVIFALAPARPGAAGDDEPHHPLDLSARDSTCAPCRDFFQYANGGWVAQFTIPPAYPSYGSFLALSDRNVDVLHSLLEDAARSVTAADPTDNASKIGVFYATCMDSVAAEAQGMKPIEPELATIAALHGPADLPAEIARLHSMGVTAMFRVGAQADLKNSDLTIASR